MPRNRSAQPLSASRWLLVGLLSALLSLISLTAFAQPPVAPAVPALKLLVIPTRDLSGEGPAGIEAAVTDALLKELNAVPGWQVWANEPQAQPVLGAIADKLLTPAEARNVADLPAAQRLGLVWGADTVLIGLLVRQDNDIVLLVNIAGTVGRQVAGPGKQLDIPPIKTPVSEASTPEQLAGALTKELTTTLLPLIQQNRGLWAHDPALASAWESEGDTLLAQGDSRGARMAFAAALVANSNLGSARRKLAQALLALGQTDQARAQLEQALAQNAKDPEVLLALGQTYLTLGNPGRAAGYYSSAAYLAPNDLRPKQGLAAADVARGNLPQALKSYQELLKAKPENVALHYGYGVALAKGKNFSQAQAEFSRCLRLSPDYGIARKALANVLIEQGQYADGIEQLRLLTETLPNGVVYRLAEYQRLTKAVIEEFNGVASAFDGLLSGYWDGSVSQADFIQETNALHNRSDNLARLLERITPPQELDKSHRYWVLAVNLLNHSDFEAYRYAQNEGQDYLRRAQLFRQTAREAATEARSFAAR